MEEGQLGRYTHKVVSTTENWLLDTSCPAPSPMAASPPRLQGQLDSSSRELQHLNPPKPNGRNNFPIPLSTILVTPSQPHHNGRPATRSPPRRSKLAPELPPHHPPILPRFPHLYLYTRCHPLPQHPLMKFAQHPFSSTSSVSGS